MEGQSLRLRRLGEVVYRPYGPSPDAGVILAETALLETARWMAAWSEARRVVFHTSDTAVMRAAVAGGLGIALLPDFFSGDLPPVGDASLARPIHLTLHKDMARSPRVRIVVDAVAEIVAAWARGARRLPPAAGLSGDRSEG